MGLDTTHNCWHGPYTAFTRWRHAVAMAAGYEVWPVKYEDGIARDCIMVDWGHLGGAAHLLGLWEETPEDPLLVLFVHADHEGIIRPAQAGPLADALERLLPNLSDTTYRGLRGDKSRTEQFIAGLRLAVERGEDVEFR